MPLVLKKPAYRQPLRAILRQFLHRGILLHDMAVLKGISCSSSHFLAFWQVLHLGYSIKSIRMVKLLLFREMSCFRYCTIKSRQDTTAFCKQIINPGVL